MHQTHSVQLSHFVQNRLTMISAESREFVRFFFTERCRICGGIKMWCAKFGICIQGFSFRWISQSVILQCTSFHLGPIEIVLTVFLKINSNEYIFVDLGNPAYDEWCGSCNSTRFHIWNNGTRYTFIIWNNGTRHTFHIYNN